MPMPVRLRVSLLFFNILFIAAAADPVGAVSRSDDGDSCVYSIYIRTGSIIKGGTDANLTLTLYDEAGIGLRINNIEAWGGLMDPGHDYFERGNLDIFSGRGPCLSQTPCKMNITSDGTGSSPGWYCNYVEVTTTGPQIPCTQQTFKVDQWLASNVFPFKLSAIRDNCPGSSSTSHSPSPLFSIVCGQLMEHLILCVFNQ